MPTESLLTNGEWLPGELLGGSERQTPSWFLDMNIRLLDTDCGIYGHPLLQACHEQLPQACHEQLEQFWHLT